MGVFGEVTPDGGGAPRKVPTGLCCRPTDSHGSPAARRRLAGPFGWARRSQPLCPGRPRRAGRCGR